MTAKRRTNSARREESQEKILDAAETLFASDGFSAVSLKDISNAAGVDAGLLHYYFASKAGLFTAVINRRAEVVNVARLRSLKSYAATAGETLTLEGVLRAYLEPTFAFVIAGGEGYANYMTIIAQLNSMPAGSIPGSGSTPFDEVVQVFIGQLRQACPAATEAQAYWFYHMLSGAISLSWARTGRIDKLSDGLCRSTDFEAIAANMISVFSHGLPSGRP